MISCVSHGAVQRYPVVLSWLVLVKAAPLELEQRSGILSYAFSIVTIGSHYFQIYEQIGKTAIFGIGILFTSRFYVKRTGHVSLAQFVVPLIKKFGVRIYTRKWQVC